MSADGLRIARLDAIWAWAEPDPPVGGVHTYRWDRDGSSLDDAVALFARHNVRIAAVLALAPGWAANGSADLAPEHYGDYAAFAGAFAARYGANGTFWAEHPELPRTPIRDYQVWTEANSSNFFTHAPDPAEYLKVVGPVAAAVHAADPGHAGAHRHRLAELRRVTSARSTTAGSRASSTASASTPTRRTRPRSSTSSSACAH